MGIEDRDAGTPEIAVPSTPAVGQPPPTVARDRLTESVPPSASAPTLALTVTPTTVIGPSIVIRGKLRSAEDLVVRGRIDAAITSTRALIIEASGIVKANVEVKSIRISGILVGDILAEERVEIAAGGRVIGDIYSPRVMIADGAAFRGNIDMVGAPVKKSASVVAAGPTPRDAPSETAADDPTTVAWKKLQQDARKR